ncbi:MAG: hypothetical protein EOO39_39405, partial [Cytophagaceae bacterium]
YLFLLFCSGLASAQPVIGSPVDFTLCDNGNDGVEILDLTTQTAGILNGLSPATHTLNYYMSLADALNSVNPISVPSAFTATSGQPIYVGVFANANPSQVATTNFTATFMPGPTAVMFVSQPVICQSDLVTITFMGSGPFAPYTFMYALNGVAGTVVSDGAGVATLSLSDLAPGTYSISLNSVSSSMCQTPLSGQTAFTVVSNVASNQAPDLTISETPSDGVATFDLTSNGPIILGTLDPLNHSLSYHITMADAANGTNPLSGPSAFINSVNPQTIYVRVQNNQSGCFVITSFDLHVVDSGIVNIPDANLKAALVNASSTVQIGSTVFPNSSNTPDVYTTIDTNADGEIQFSEAEAIVFLNVNNKNILSMQGIEAFTNLRFLYCANNGLTALDPGNLPNLTYLGCYENMIASVDLSGLPA